MDLKKDMSRFVLILLLALYYKTSECHSTFDLKILTIINNCSSNFYHEIGMVDLNKTTGQREFFEFKNENDFNDWIDLGAWDLPHQVHQLVNLCSNSSGKSTTMTEEAERLVNLVITLALDPTYYIIENPGIVYNNTKFSRPVKKWIKQTNIALIYSSLPANLTVLLSELMTFSEIPITVDIATLLPSKMNWFFHQIFDQIS